MNIRKVAAHAALFAQSTVQRASQASRRIKSKQSPSTDRTALKLSALEVCQDPNSTSMHLRMKVAGNYVPDSLWVEIDNSLEQLCNLQSTQFEVDGSEALTTLECEVDLDSIVSQLPSAASHHSEPASASIGNDGHVLRFYLGYENLDDEALTWSDLEVTNEDSAVGLVRLGRAHQTATGQFGYRRAGDHFYYPLVTKRGHLVIEVDREHKPYAHIRNDGVTVHDGLLQVRGRVFARGTEYLGAEFVAIGRTTGFKATSRARLELDEDRTARRFGLRQYTFSGEIDFSGLVEQISDDNVDLYLDLDHRLGSEPRRARIGKSRYLVRMATEGGAVTSGGKTVSIAPYYTFKAKNPSLTLETFETSTYDYLKSELSLAKLKANRKRKSKPIWIIGELPYKAQDNGLQFFKYMRDSHPEIDSYYVIRADLPERRNLDGYDHVIDFRSPEHIRLTLSADKIIGTHHPNFLYPTREPQFQRALQADQIFLQHGVTAAKWMVPNYGKATAGFDTDLITVCSEREKEFVVQDFGYRPDEIAVTGFARFDSLLDDSVALNRQQLMIMPTWRPWLQDPEFFTESEYFDRWKSLLRSDRFRKLVDDYRLEPIFCLHPNMQQFSSHFEGNGARVVVQGEIDVQFLLKQSGMLITDYSSVAFDFSFLHKPVAYYQFDSHMFAPPHADPIKEFPGPVVAEENELLDSIERAYQSNAEVEETYRLRADRFLLHRDTQSRERIFQAISSMKKSRPHVSDVLDKELAQTVYRVVRRRKQYLPTMKQAYKAMRKAPLDSNTIVFESGQGKQFGDSPRAIYEELIRRGDTRRKVWVYNKPLPFADEHTVVVKRHSPAFFWYLATAKYWINNHNFPNYIHRRKGGLYIQTWHGTPLKRMFLDQENFFGRDAGYIDRVKEASAQWNALVSPSPYATRAMQSSYGYTGPVYEIGYPRNDILRAEDREQIGVSVRQQLGIPSSKTVVLYAPTFRDDQPTSKGRFAFEWPFSLEEFTRELGPDVVLIVRTHVLNSTKLEIPAHLQDSVKDASNYPDIQQLFLASDMLVTDYSSSFFDFSVLQRPIVFFAYDLEKYRDQLRGFYLDYNTDLPGPITRTPQELFNAIRNMMTMDDDQRRQLREFAERFAPNDDGNASGRVIDRLLS